MSALGNEVVAARSSVRGKGVDKEESVCYSSCWLCDEIASAAGTLLGNSEEVASRSAATGVAYFPLGDGYPRYVPV